MCPYLDYVYLTIFARKEYIYPKMKLLIPFLPTVVLVHLYFIEVTLGAPYDLIVPSSLENIDLNPGEPVYGLYLGRYKIIIEK